MKRISVLSFHLVLIAAAIAYGNEPVKIGFIFSTSGRMGSFGSIAVQGSMIALKELNEKGGVNGRSVEGVFRNSTGDPDVAELLFRNLVENEKVDVVIGIHSDSIALRLAPLSARYGVPLLVTGAQTALITGRKCNRYTFRLCPDSKQNARIAALLARWTDASKWSIIASDNLGNRELWRYFKRNLARMKPDVSFVDDAAAVFLGHSQTQWERVFRKIIASKTEGLLISVRGGDFLEFFNQGHKYRLFDGKREFVAVSASLSGLLSLGHNMPKGIWWSTPYWFQAGRSPVNLRFARAYEKKFGAPPSWQAQFAYAAVKIYAKAAEKVGNTSPQSIVSFLEGFTTEIPVGKITIHADDHQAVTHGMAGKTARMAVTLRKFSFRAPGSMILFRRKEIETPAVERDCRLK